MQFRRPGGAIRRGVRMPTGNCAHTPPDRCIYTYMKNQPEFLECASCSCFAVRRAARVITQHYDRHLRPTGMRATQFAMLTLLSLLGPLPLGVLANRLGAERTTVSRNLRLLIAQRLVASGAAEDRRVQILSLTPKGTRAMRKVLPYWRAAQASITRQFTPETLHDLSRTAQAALRGHTAGRGVASGRHKEV
jgi:DNA-binding MarR family transcriptional regulator